MNNLYNENGFLTEAGKKYLENHFDSHVKTLLAYSADEQEINIFASLLMKRVGDLVAEHKATVKEHRNSIEAVVEKLF
jgi:hypothetical protein